MPPESYRIALINMPFARLSMPSLAITQLTAVLKDRFKNQVDISIHYLNLDFAAYLEDPELYEHCLSGKALLTGIGDWFFRRSAFPDAEDNAEAYYARFYHEEDRETQSLKRRIEEKRAGLNDCLDHLIDLHGLGQADLVGFTTLFSQTAASLAMAGRIKARYPDILTVIGGAACEAEMGLEIAEHVPQIDAVFSGPALESFPEFVEQLLKGDPMPCGQIKGIFTRTHLAARLKRKDHSGIALLGKDQDINQLIPLDYHPFLDQLDTAFPDKKIPPVLLFETSRGCWWAEKSLCSFCGLNGLQMKHRALRPELARAHLEALYEYVPRCRIFMCVDTILPKRYTREVFPRLTPPPEMTLYYELKVDISKRELQVLVDAGVRAFQPGIESLSSETLKRMHKGTNAFRNLIFLKDCSEHSVHIDWNLLIFSPGEPESVYEKTLQDIPSLVHLAPPTGAYPISFARFSRYFKDPDSYGIELKPQDFYGFTYPFDAESVFNLAYHFVDQKADTDRIDYWLDSLGAAIENWSRRWLGSDDQPQARLCFAGDEIEWAVYDSRSGIEKETTISKFDKNMLLRLNSPQSLPQLCEEFGNEAESALNRFLQNQWMFSENGRFLSLIT